jgi:small subunit ribosomal protein S20
MPNIASAKKRMRQNETRRMRNRSRRSRLRSSLRKLDEAIEAGDMEAVQAEWKEAQSLLDRTARRGVIHPNTASRKKARLANRIAGLSSN